VMRVWGDVEREEISGTRIEVFQIAPHGDAEQGQEKQCDGLSACANERRGLFGVIENRRGGGHDGKLPRQRDCRNASSDVQIGGFVGSVPSFSGQDACLTYRIAQVRVLPGPVVGW
jgi:hypothetical protein